MPVYKDNDSKVVDNLFAEEVAKNVPYFFYIVSICYFSISIFAISVIQAKSVKAETTQNKLQQSLL